MSASAYSGTKTPRIRYSLTEHDLYPQVGPLGESYSIRRNINDELYEIFDYQHNQAYSDQAVWYSSPELKHVAQEARDLETAATGSTKHQDTVRTPPRHPSVPARMDRVPKPGYRQHLSNSDYDRHNIILNELLIIISSEHFLFSIEEVVSP